MNIGDKLVLHSNAFPHHAEEQPDEIIVITISEMRHDVQDMWCDKKDHTGYKAKDEKGREFSCNWTSFPSDSMTPMWRWFCENKSYYDITMIYDCPKVPKFLQDEKFADVLGFCEVHHEFFLKHLKFDEKQNTEECFHCFLERTYPNSENTIKEINRRKELEAKQKLLWNGWF